MQPKLSTFARYGVRLLSIHPANLVPAESAPSHVVSLDKHLKATGYSRQLPLVDRGGAHG